MDPLPTNTLVIIIIAFLALAVLGFIFVSHGNESKKGLGNIFDILKGVSSKEISISAGHKALHVKIDTDTTPVSIFEFHPTDEGTYGNEHLSDYVEDSGERINQFFSIKKFRSDRCVLFTSEATKEGLIRNKPLDKDYIHYVIPGSIILSGVSNSKIKDFITFDRGCEEVKCKDMGRSEYSICATECKIAPWVLCKRRYGFSCDKKSSDKILTQVFTDSVTDKCSDFKEYCPKVNDKKDCCPLLDTTIGGTHVYKLKYDIACGYEQSGKGWSNEAKWLVCNEENEGVTITDKNHLQLKCKNYKWVIEYGEGIYISGAKIKYKGIVDKDTSLEFKLNNYANKKIENAKITVAVTNPDRDCDLDKETSSVNCGNIDNMETCEFKFDNFCWKAKTFDISLSYAGGAGTFNLDCRDAKEDEWTSCKTSYSVSEYHVSNDVPIFSGTCSDKKYYKVFLSGVVQENIIVTVFEDNAEKYKNKIVDKGKTETFDSIKISVKDIDYNNRKALIGVSCK